VDGLLTNRLRIWSTRPSEPLRRRDPDLARRTGHSPVAAACCSSPRLTSRIAALSSSTERYSTVLSPKLTRCSPLASAVSSAWSWASV
jgi:hypothetical protein